jgi:hypothetical protein
MRLLRRNFGVIEIDFLKCCAKSVRNDMVQMLSALLRLSRVNRLSSAALFRV